jgi:hypothetical protein
MTRDAEGKHAAAFYVDGDIPRRLFNSASKLLDTLYDNHWTKSVNGDL